jgi:hypothetical protein
VKNCTIWLNYSSMMAHRKNGNFLNPTANNMRVYNSHEKHSATWMISGGNRPAVRVFRWSRGGGHSSTHTAVLAQLRSYTRVNCCLLQHRTASPVGNAIFAGPAWIPGNRLQEHGRNKVWIKGTILGYSQWIKYSESTGGEDNGDLFEWFSEEGYTVCLWFRIT